MLSARDVITELRTADKGPELLAAAQKLRKLNLGFTKVAQLLGVPGLRSWLYAQLVHGPHEHPKAPAILLAHLREYLPALTGALYRSSLQIVY